MDFKTHLVSDKPGGGIIGQKNSLRVPLHKGQCLDLSGIERKHPTQNDKSSIDGNTSRGENI
jgi:hypothetical protein